MSFIQNLLPDNILITAVCLLLTIVAHELAHGGAALLMGDTTAKDAGRLSLNPIKHMDPLGTLSLLFFRFGWAKPVPINPNRFRNRKAGMLFVSAAGAGMNLLLATVSVGLFIYTGNKHPLWAEFQQLMILYNVYFAVFNLLPFPPLDGSKIVFSFLPVQMERKVYQYQRYFYIILVIFVFSGALQRILVPAANAIIRFLVGLFL